MLELITKDKDLIDDNYNKFLYNLYNYLCACEITTGIACASEVIKMLHAGKFSMNNKNICSNNYDFLHLPNLVSDGMLVMYGICCCRHATKLIYDIMTTMRFECSLQYILVSNNNSWHIANATNSNHIVVKLEESGKSYLLDAINKFIVEILKNGDLKQLDLGSTISYEDYNDSNIGEIGKVLTKYYQLKNIGVDYIYDDQY